MRGERVGWVFRLASLLALVCLLPVAPAPGLAGEAARPGRAEDGLRRLVLVPAETRRDFPDAELVRDHPLDGTVRAVLARLWRVAGARRGRTVGLGIVAGTRGFQAISVPAVDGIWLSAEYLMRLQDLHDEVRARRLARVLSHELGHVLAGHEGHSEANELEAERIGVRLFERAGFDCTWWVESLGEIVEPSETPGRIAGLGWAEAWAGLTKARLLANAEEACRAAKAAGPPPAR